MTDTIPLHGTAQHQHAGRVAPDYPSFTFPSSGRTVQVRKLSPMTMQRIGQALRKAQPPPPPPVIEVKIDGGVQQQETNEADPAYQQALRQYEQRINAEVAERFMRLCATYALVSAVPADEVAEYRAAMEAAGAPVDEDDDRVVYLWEMCATGEDDIQQFQAGVLSLSQATQEAVQAHIRSFRGDV